ncbi:baseplate J/gp47 family protein [Haliangium sp.]|uniref:baseplate J/gp47 family protein n=1 Tax=Haliangium sp. TaxID=2663208 RepID=UPI003D0F625D
MTRDLPGPKVDDALRAVRPFNPPGRDAVRYRATTYGQSLRRMLTRLPDEMAGLSLRYSDDPTVALLDAWAMAADVLTFYQERIANEGYIRTATERRSIVELARHVVYDLDRGQTATAHVAFTVDDSAGDPAREVAIPPGTRVLSVPAAGEPPVTFETDEGLIARAAWNAIAALPGGTPLAPPAPAFVLPSEGPLHLDGIDTGLSPGATLLATPSAGGADDSWYLTVERVDVDRDLDRTTVQFSRRATGDVRAASMRDPVVLRLDEELGALNHDVYVATADAKTSPVLALRGERRGQILPGTWLVLADANPGGPVFARAVERLADGTMDDPDYRLPRLQDFSDFADLASDIRDKISIEPIPIPTIAVTRMELASGALALPEDGYVVVRAGSEELPLWRDRAADRATTLGPVVELVSTDDLSPDLADALRGRYVAVHGVVGGQPAAEIARVAGVATGADTRLLLEHPLEHPFDPVAMTINANVAQASHGETIFEILGDGNSARTNQAFPLRHGPVSVARSPSDPAGAIEVRVNGIPWQPVSSLHERDGDFCGYMVRVHDDGRATIRFGDGIHGARLPSGLGNVEATYRVGLGPAGNVPAGRLSLLTNPPPGVIAAVNPAPARGGRAPSSLEDNRKRAMAATVASSGAASQASFADIAVATGLVRAVSVRRLTAPGTPELIHLTLVGNDPGEDSLQRPTDRLLRDLRDELSRRAHSPGRRFVVAVYTPLPVTIRATLDLEAAASQEAVEAQARASLGLSARTFAETMTPAGVERTLAMLPGVAGATDVTLELDPGTTVDRVIARRAHVRPDGAVVSAQLLVPELELTFSP